MTSPSNARRFTNISNGIVLIGSDGHYWPGPAPTAHRAFVKFTKTLKPKLVIYNGDAFDGANISRHATIGWEHVPSVIDQLRVTSERLGEIEKAAKGAELIWTLGNHDARYETYLSNRVPEYSGIKGFAIKDHFPLWKPAWSVQVNSGINGVIIKHRFKGGIHAARNNALNSGMNVVTGHLHKLQVRAVTDYTGTRWGSESGMLGEPTGPMFMAYLEDNPVDWQAGFLVLTFIDGSLMWPEPVFVMGEGLVTFRGELIRV